MTNQPRSTSDLSQLQRLRLTFSRRSGLKWLSHLDMMRLWERALRRAEVSLAFSQGYTPHPRIAMALPLPVGVEGEAELMDIYLVAPLSPLVILQRTSPQLPDGVALHGVEEVALGDPSLQSRVRCADYEILLDTSRPREEIQAAVQTFLASNEAVLEARRGKRVGPLDIRRLVVSLAVTEGGEGACGLRMRLRADSTGAGRPEEVARALGIEERPLAIRRMRLVLEGEQ